MKAILLLSGGIDSPVAAHLIQRKGYEIAAAVHFYNKHLGNVNTIEKCKKLCDALGIRKLIAIPFDEQQAEIVRKCVHKFYYLIQRRLMWRIAEQVALQEQAHYLITGENLGQVASQTLSNMQTTQHAVKMLILRPLLCNDKNETIALARKIGTYELSKGPEMCCLLGPKHPATTSRVEIIEDEERKLDIPRLVQDSLKQEVIC